jgi:putative isomerase
MEKSKIKMQNNKLEIKNTRDCLLCLLVASIIFLGTSCGKEGRYSYQDFPDVLNMKNVPEQAEDWSAFCFSDLGAWFGFALPGEADSNYFGGFSGPFLMTHGRWLSPCLIRLILIDTIEDESIDFSESTNVMLTAYPGRLCQEYEVSGIGIALELIYLTSRTAMMRVRIVNHESFTKRYRIGWRGSVFLDETLIRAIPDGVRIAFDKNPVSARVVVNDHDGIGVNVSDDSLSYEILKYSEIAIGPNQSIEDAICFSLFMVDTEWAGEELRTSETLKNPETAFLENAARWDGYLGDVLNVDSQWAKDRGYRRMAVKALMTLISNWRSAAGDLLHDGLFPSYAVRYFNGFWAWDSWKHAVALVKFAPELAKDQIRTMFDYQDEYGMVADVIYADKTENNWRDTKPPLAAWAVWKVYETTGDKEFLQEMFPKLMKYHGWWHENRDHDRNGLCEYGSTDGKLIAAKWESGMDDAVRFDSAAMIQNNSRAWSMNQESVDLNGYLYAEKNYLVSIAQILGEEDAAERLHRESEILKGQIQTLMFDEVTGYFYDIRLEDKAFVRHQGPEGWIPLWAGIATEEPALRVKNVMTDTTKFATFCPFPTVSKDDPKFMTGYWRGPVWLDQAYFGVKALERYGFHDEAELFVRQLFDHPEGLKDSDAPIRENYDPRDGKGLRVNHFSWSAAHLLMLFWGE